VANKCPKCNADNPETSRFCSDCGAQIVSAKDVSVTRTIQEPLVSSGKIIAGKYKILAELGRGGMGVVYKAEDTRLKRIVALKFLPAPLTEDKEAKKRFIQEAQAAAALEHPNICTVYEVDEADGQTFIAMSYIEGQSLKGMLQGGPMEIEEAKNIALQVAEGLREAHEKGIVHRDIKPANIMITKKGQAKITDFGLAKLSWGVDLTKPSTIMGTVAYMSPEQVRGEKIDHRTDIWSFGCLLYELLTGHGPFRGGHEQAIIHAIIHSSPQSIVALRQDVPVGLDKILTRCLQKNPLNRYPDTESLVKVLKIIELDDIDTSPALPPQEQSPSIAVLPFADMSPEKDQEYFAEGIAEELINALGQIQGLRVVARTSAFALKGMNLDIRDIGQKLDVKAVLEGSIRKAGNRLRIMAQLIEAATGLHIWSERFDREECDIFDIQDEISLAIVEHLKVTLLSGEKMALSKKSTTDTEAYNRYLKGLYLMARPSPETIKKALTFFRQALDRDPKFAQAHTGIANVYFTLANANWATPSEMFPKAKSALEEALALDPNLAEAHGFAANLQFWFEWNWAAAEKSFCRVLELNPSDAMGRGMYAWLLLTRKRFEESMAEIKRAITIDPLMPLLYAYSIGIHGAAGHIDEALADFSRVQQIEPNFGLAFCQAGWVYLRKGLIDKAIKTFEQARRLSVPLGWAEAPLIICHLMMDERAKAENILVNMQEQRKKLPVSATCLAIGFAALGDFDTAFEWLETAIQERDSMAVVIHFFGQALAEDPRFDAFLNRLGLPL